ncbi:MAG: bifunctional folylpolyglutamate synthase/dihydrofolate synthase [Candidatus Thermoplasmatota archaeon]|nr:bifunctional folylpolyglutamate synthase/dihydrofolate synthase [Candidatus Thermoplasmatota archaeon]MCL5786244.1 bifunctional folylpolyglutamate synthase/dihydrofolate synthase [Candidatus Thermoplasmatota archaeon]
MDKRTLDYIYALKREGVKLDLDIVSEFSRVTGDSYSSFDSVHVAGTNGKGSTSCLIYNVLNLSARTGLYTSPHLVKFNERVVSGVEMIPDSYIEKFVNDHMGDIEKLKTNNRNPTFFEVTTVMAFDYFRDTGCKRASIEVGLGGRLDATNILRPQVAVITQIGYEHANLLGGSLTSIAREKGGIIKPGIPVVVGERKPEPLKELARIAGLMGSKLIQVDRACRTSNEESTVQGNSVRVATDRDTYDLRCSMPGKYQIRNLLTSVIALENLPDPPSRVEIEKGIENSRWPGRLELVRDDPPIILDSAHNPPAAQALVTSLKGLLREEPILMVGQLKDKDYFSFLNVIRHLSGRIVLTTPDEEDRAEDPYKLLPICKGLFRESSVIPDPVEAYEYVKNQGSAAVITGSIYLVGLIKGLENSSLNPFK